ncbi:major facilitator superfamily domain-containing protein [Microdochium bolleyi]|uniref:Major facilitator superfamily domain-containing protein n=1 Tax=Microdochium bolleyi TaxID=196109 RepID=A0A136JIA5_9PEZI|nr:major facilitator superfamily domain-containing protein [Microdochium bolleyi]
MSALIAWPVSQSGPPCGHHVDPEPCPSCRAEKRAARIYRTKVICCLILPYALQALDTTLIASAFPWISLSFAAFSQQNWIVSAFNLTSAAFVPFWGQMADIFGRHAALQACMVIMLVGSAICVGSPSIIVTTASSSSASPTFVSATAAYGVFLLGRALQGLACAGLGVVIRVVLADKVSLAENARNTTIFTFTAGISYGLGPVVGGALTGRDWRWCFAINLPIAFAGMLVVYGILRGELLGPQSLPELERNGDGGAQADQDGCIAAAAAVPQRDQRHPQPRQGQRFLFVARLATVDVGGQLLFLFGFGLLILALTWGGAIYPWSHPAVLSPLIISVVMIAGWLVYEYLLSNNGGGNSSSKSAEHSMLRSQRWWSCQRPMMPWFLISNRNIGLLFYIQFATGMAMYCVLYFVNLYYTLVKQHTASEAGVQLLFYTPGLAVGVYLSMYLCNVYPRQTFHPLLLGSIIEAVGIGMLAWALHTESSKTIFGMMALTGAGTGLRFMPTSLHAIGMFPDHIATVVSLMNVALPFGGTLALTIMSAVFNNIANFTVSSEGSSQSLSGIAHGESGGSGEGGSGILSGLPLNESASVAASAKRGIVWAFVAIVPFMLLCVFAAATLGNVTVAKKKGERDNKGSGDMDGDEIRDQMRPAGGEVEANENTASPSVADTAANTASAARKTGLSAGAADGGSASGAVLVIHEPYLVYLLRRRRIGAFAGSTGADEVGTDRSGGRGENLDVEASLGRGERA